MPTIEEQILEELKMLNANIQKLNCTMAKPRPKRSRRKLSVFEEAERQVAKSKRYGILA